MSFCLLVFLILATSIYHAWMDRYKHTITKKENHQVSHVFFSTFDTNWQTSIEVDEATTVEVIVDDRIGTKYYPLPLGVALGDGAICRWWWSTNERVVLYDWQLLMHNLFDWIPCINCTIVVEQDVNVHCGLCSDIFIDQKRTSSTNMSWCSRLFSTL